MNSNLAQSPATDPFQILRYRDRQYAAELIAAALLHFDLFSWLDSQSQCTTDDLLLEFGLQPRPTDVLLTLCRANQFIQTADDGFHSLTCLGQEHLVKSSPWFLGPYYEPIRGTPITQGFLQVLTTDKPGNWQAKHDSDDWHASMLKEEFARSFTALMNCRGLAMGQRLAEALTPLLAGRKQVLDIAGGSGIYACTLAAKHTHLSAVVLEQSPVDVIVGKEIEKHGMGDRVKVFCGDMFQDDWPDGSDVILFSNVLHDWDFPEVEALLRKAAEYLPQNGLLIIHDAFINDAKTGPLPVAEYSALLMNITQGKCYSHAEYTSILETLSFEVGPYQDTIADRGFMTAIRK